MKLADAFTAELNALINPGSAFRIAKQSYSRSQLAEELSGTKDHKSKAYKAARRNLERYEAGAGKQQRQPSQATLEKLVNILKQDDKAIDQAVKGDVNIDIQGEVWSSQDHRQRHINFDLSKEQLADALKAQQSGNHAEFWQKVFEPYGFVPDGIGSESVTIRE